MTDAAGSTHFTLDFSGNAQGVARDLAAHTVTRTRYLGQDMGKASVVSSTTYDLLERPISMTDDGRTKTWEYLPNGAIRWAGQTGSATPTGPAVEYLYGTMGRLAQKNLRNGSTVTGSVKYHYETPAGAAYVNTAGRLAWTETCDTGASCDLPTTKIAYGYDADGRELRRDEWFAAIDSTSGALPQSVQVTRRRDGAVVSTTVSSPNLGLATGNSLTYDNFYDTMGRLVQVSGSLDGTATTYWQAASGYDELGRLTATQGDNGHVQATWSYDTASSNHLSAYTAGYRSGTTGAFTQVLDVGSMVYQGEKLTSYNEAVGGNSFSYTYDHEGRLASASATDLGTPGNVAVHQAAYTQKFTSYQSADGAPDFSGTSTLSNWTLQGVQPDATHQLDYSYAELFSKEQTSQIALHGVANDPAATQLGYDAEGRGLVTTVGSQGFDYDAAMRLSAINNAETMLSYDGSGTLAVRALTTGKTLAYAGAFLTITKQQDATTTARAEILVGGIRVASVWHDSAGAQSLYYHRDRLGSVNATSKGGGTAGAAYRYDAWGAVVAQSGDDDPAKASDLGYTSGLRLSAALIHLRARVYNPALRQFMQPDNIDSIRFSYVRGDPVNFNDPSGHMMSAGDFWSAHFRQWAWADAIAAMPDVSGSPDERGSGGDGGSSAVGEDAGTTSSGGDGGDPGMFPEQVINGNIRNLTGKEQQFIRDSFDMNGLDGAGFAADLANTYLQFLSGSSNAFTKAAASFGVDASKVGAFTVANVIVFNASAVAGWTKVDYGARLIHEAVHVYQWAMTFDHDQASFDDARAGFTRMAHDMRPDLKGVNLTVFAYNINIYEGMAGRVSSQAMAIMDNRSHPRIVMPEQPCDPSGYSGCSPW